MVEQGWHHTGLTQLVEVESMHERKKTMADLSLSLIHISMCIRDRIDALMHSRIANLFYAKYGRRDSQEQCGAGSHTNNRTKGCLLYTSIKKEE